MADVDPITRHFRQCRRRGTQLASHKDSVGQVSSIKGSIDCGRAESKKPTYAKPELFIELPVSSKSTNKSKKITNRQKPVRESSKSAPKSTQARRCVKENEINEITKKSEIIQPQSPKRSNKSLVPSSPSKVQKVDEPKPTAMPSTSTVRRQLIPTDTNAPVEKSSLSELGSSNKECQSLRYTTLGNDSKQLEVILACNKDEISKALKLPEDELVLPMKFQILLEKCVGVDSAMQMLFNRNELSTFKKVRSGVESLTTKQFSMRDLAKIVHLWPTAFSLSYDKIYKSIVNKTFEYVLVIKANLTLSKTQFLATELTNRKKVYRMKLLNIVHETHTQFLLNASNVSLDPSEVLRWHPKFKLESVSDVPEAELPKPPESQTNREGLNELILKTREKATEKMERAIALLESQMSPKSCTKSVPTATELLERPAANSLNGLSEKLKAKIAAKEALKLRENLTMSPEDRKHNALKEKIPEVAKSLRAMFLSDKRNAIPQDEVFPKIKSGLRTFVSLEDISACVGQIAKVCPEWLQMVNVQNAKYIKVSKAIKFNEVLVKVSK